MEKKISMLRPYLYFMKLILDLPAQAYRLNRYTVFLETPVGNLVYFELRNTLKVVSEDINQYCDTHNLQYSDSYETTIKKEVQPEVNYDVTSQFLATLQKFAYYNFPRPEPNVTTDRVVFLIVSILWLICLVLMAG